MVSLQYVMYIQGVIIFDTSNIGPVLMMDVSNSTALNSTHTVYYYVPEKYQNGELRTSYSPGI